MNKLNKKGHNFSLDNKPQFPVKIKSPHFF